jgi:CHAT domain-containing protein/Flp pilus assembly protein TadD
MKRSALKSLDYLRQISTGGVMFLALVALTGITAAPAWAAPDASLSVRQTTSPEDVRELQPGAPIERELQAGKTDTYKIALTSGQYINVVVEQLGINVEVAASDPKAKQVASVDWWWREGSESLWIRSETEGPHTVKVTASTHPIETGKYRIRIEKIGKLSDATASDKDMVAAYELFAEAERLRVPGTADSQREAMKKYLTALELWRTLRNVDAEAQTLSTLGLIDYQLGNLKHAGEYLNPAIELFRSSGNRRGEVDAMNTLSVVYAFSGESQKALDNYYRALPMARAIKDHITEARILSGLGVVFPRLGQPAKALEALNELLLLAKATSNTRGEAMAHNNIGFVNLGQGRLREAIDHYSQTLSLLQGIGDRLNQATILNNIGSAYARMGEYQKGLDFLLQGLNLARLNGDKRTESMNLGGIGHLYMKLGDYRTAAQYCEQSLVLSRESGYRVGESAALNNLGIIKSVTGELQKSLEYFNQALAASVQVGDRNTEASILTSLGTAHDRLDEPHKALDHYNKALEIRRNVGDQYGEAYTLSGIGAAYAKLNDQDKARASSLQALALAKAIGDKPGEASILHQLARLERGRNNLSEAQSRIEAALAIVESTRTKVSFSDVRAIYFASRQELFDFYIDLLMQLHRSGKSETYIAKALEASERSRARSLLDSLAESHADIRNSVDPELSSRERRLRQDLQAKADQQVRLLSRKHTPEQAATVAKEIEELITENDQVLAQIRQSSPRYAALTQPQPLGLAEIQQQVVDENTLLLEYSLGEERSYLWAVTPTTITGLELPARAKIESEARRVYESLTARNRVVRFEKPEERQKRITRADAEYRTASSALSKMLLGPIAERLGRKRLLIVSDGALQYVPFGALPIPSRRSLGKKSSVLRAGDYQPLITEHEIVSLPSASTLSVLRRESVGRRRATRAVAVFADPVFHEGDPRVGGSRAIAEKQPTEHSTKSVETVALRSEMERSARDTGGLEFRRLPFSRNEAEGITTLTSDGQSKKSLDFEASRLTATSADLSNYRVIHFATHGLLNSQHPELSGIVLSLVDENGKPQDGFLRLNEIYNLKLGADLVVLSACRTALGKEIKGEGLIGVTRGFMYAGAPRVVASLWAVDDEMTAEWMKRFYREMLIREAQPAAALRAAQVSIWKEKRLPPYFWAAFVLQGEWK